MKFLIIFLSFLSFAHAENVFTCASNNGAVVTDQPDFDKFEIRGTVENNGNLSNVTIAFAHLKMRDAFIPKIFPVTMNPFKYQFRDGLDFSYNLELSKSPKVTIFSEGQYISTEPLTCR